MNDSLDMMFDTTAYGEYKSFSRTQVERSQPRQEEWEDEEEEDEDEDAEGDGGSSHCEIEKKKNSYSGLVNGFIIINSLFQIVTTTQRAQEPSAKQSKAHMNPSTDYQYSLSLILISLSLCLTDTRTLRTWL